MKTKLTHLFLMILAVFMLPNISNGQTNFTIGTGTSSNGTYSYPAPYGSYFGGSKNQMIFTASELIAAGASAGSIESIAFDVATVKGIALNNFTIKVGATTESVAYATFLTGLTEVFTTTSYTEVSGWNTHVFSTPFAWDGISNIVIETSLQNSSTTTNAKTYYTSTSSNSCTYYRGYSVSSSTSGSTAKNRPNIQIGINMVPETNDLEIMSWETPVSPIIPTSASVVSVMLKNAGVEMVDTFDISYSIDGGATYIVETYNDSLSAGDTLVYSFINQANMPAGVYNCIASVHNVGDTVNTNDTLTYLLNSGTPLSGTYTVGSATTDDYASISAIANELEIFGVSGPVVVNLAAETFDEQVSINGPITGMSATNNLIINGHGASTIITSANTSSSDRDIFRINGQSYITLDSISIISTGTSNYNAGIRIMESDYITIKNCNITVPANTTSNTNGILVSGSITSSSSSTNSNYLTFENNTITNGYYGIKIYGNSSSHSTNLKLRNNTIYNFYNYGIYSYYQDSVIITNNTLEGSVNSSYDYGIYLYRNYLGSVIANNSVVSNSTGSGYGLYVYYCEGSVANPFMIYNNMVAATQATGSFYGVYNYYGKNVSYYHNTISLNSGDDDSKALYVAGTASSSSIENIQFMNNIFSNMGSGYAVYFSDTYYPTKITAMDYNNLFAPNAAKIAHMGSDYADLASWKTASYGLDSNSVNLNPSFTSASDLHCASIVMKSLGFPIAGFDTDIDGGDRSLTTPDMGADEYTPLSNDIAIFEIISPATTIIPVGVKVPIKIKVKNFGLNTQSNLPITWSQDGGITINYDTIAINLNSLDTVTVTLKDSLFFNKISINEVTYSLGIANDDNKNNDTVKSTIIAGSPFNGIYTIGGNTADLESLSFTNTMLNLLGVDGPVIFNLNSGVYNEQIEFIEIDGASSTNTITFQSATGNKDDVMLEYNNSTSSNNYIISLNGADNFVFKNLSFSTANSSDYGRIFYFESHADTNTVMNCNLTTKYVDDDNFAAIYAYGDVNNANIIDGNTIKDCYAGIYFRGEDDDDDEYAEHNVFKNNIITNYNKYAMYLYFHDGVHVTGNTINGSATYGIYMYYCDFDVKVSKNNIIHTGNYALYYKYCDATSGNKSEISNNVISKAAKYGIYNYRGKYSDVYNNTINVNNSYYSYYLYNSSSYKGHAVSNNIFVNEGSGRAVYLKDIDGIDSLDYNNYYSPNGDYVYFADDYTDLAALKTGESSYNMHSVSIDPVFVSETDLHVLSGPLDNLGSPFIPVTDDIDGDTRSLTTPDMGADEYVFQPNNVLVHNIYGPSQMYCGSMTDSIWIDVRNLGDVVQDTIPVKAMITTPTGIVNVTDTLFANVAGTSIYNGFLLTTLNTTAEGDYTVKVYTDLANDGDRSTDTMEVVFNTSAFVASLPFAETFEIWPPANWDMNGGAFNWNYSSDRAQADFKNNDTLNCIMMTPPINLSGSTLPKVQFSYKYNYDNTITNYDSLAVEIKTCGNAWSILWAKGSERLSTVDPITSVADYNVIELDIPNTYLGQEVFIRFNGISDGGANIYITDVMLGEYPVANLPIDTTICFGSDVDFDAGAGNNYSYNWRTFSDATSLATTQMITVSTVDTFIVTVTNDVTGFATNDTVITYNYDLPTVVSFTGDADICYSDSSELSAVFTGASPWDIEYSENGVSGMQLGLTSPFSAYATPNDTTEYFITKITDANGCITVANSDTVTINVKPLPIIVMPTLADMCIDANAITLTATPAGGTYYGAGISGAVFNPVTSGAGTHTLKYVYTGMNGCKDSSTITQIVNDLPNITATSAAVNNTVPYNTATTLDATVSNAMGALTYDWSPTASINGDTTNKMPSTVAVVVATSYVVEVIDAGTSCKNTDTVNITYSGGPVTVNPISVPADICSGDTAILNAQSAGGNTTITYSWTSDPIGFTSTEMNPEVMPTQNTSYIVEATDGVNTTIDTVDVTILADPTISYSMDTTFVCSGLDGNAIVNLTGLAPFSYTYNGIMTNITSSTDIVVATALTANATYYVTSVTDANGCSSNGKLDSLQFMVNELPTVVYTGSDTICIGNSTTATATFTGVMPFEYVYNGTTVSGVNATTDDQILTPNTDSVYTVTKVTDGNGCVSMGNLDDISVSIYDLPTAVASDNDSICIGDSTMVSINFTGYAPYTFNVWNGTAMMDTMLSATDVYTTYISNSATTTYTIKSIVESNGCVTNNDFDSVEIFVNSLPTPTFSGLAADYCEDAAVVTLSGLPAGGTFTGNGITANDFDPSAAVSGNNDIEYTYIDANGCENSVIHSTVINVLPTVVISGLAADYCVDAADVSLTATPAGTGSVWSGTVTATGDFSPVTNGVGTHNVVYTFTDANGCVNSDTATTMVNALPVVTLTTLADVCDESSNFMITGGMPAGGDWSGNGVLSNYFDATTAGAGAHYLTYTFTDANGCVNFDSTIQTVNALPVLNITGLDAAYCANAATSTLTATPAGGTFFGIGVTGNIFDPSTATPGSVSVLYSYTDAITGCFNSESATTIVNAIPMVDLGSDNTVCENNTSMLDAGNAGASYLWNTGATTQTIVLDTNGNGIADVNYSVVVTDANMCTNLDSVMITYEALPVSQLTDTNTICGQNSDITLDAGYISGNTYVWSNGVSWSSITINSTDLGGYTGNMSVVITSDAGCVTNDETYVYFRENPVVDLGGDDIVCINHEFTIDAGAGFASYLWNTGATTQAITIDSNTFDVGQNMLKVEVYNDVNCSAMDSMILVVDPCTGVEMPELTDADINIYPNPTKGQFQIDVVGLENEEYNLDIYNSVGAVVYSDKVSNDGNSKQTWKLDFSTYAKGVYYVRLHSNGDIKVKRIIIN